MQPGARYCRKMLLKIHSLFYNSSPYSSPTCTVYINSGSQVVSPQIPGFSGLLNIVSFGVTNIITAHCTSLALRN